MFLLTRLCDAIYHENGTDEKSNSVADVHAGMVDEVSFLHYLVWFGAWKTQTPVFIIIWGKEGKYTVFVDAFYDFSSSW